MFIAATLFTTPKSWNQSKCLSADEWINKMCHVQMMEYYSSIERNEILTRYVSNLKTIMLNEWSQTQKATYSMFHLYEIFRIDKSIKIESRLLVVR